MMPTINLLCSYNFCAGHRLFRQDWTPEKNREIFGHCANTHGHQYRIELTVSGQISSETGMLINGYDVDRIVSPFLKENFDHKFLNDDVAFFREQQPTAEWIAVWIYTELKPLFPSHAALTRVRVFETPELAVAYPA